MMMNAQFLSVLFELCLVMLMYYILSIQTSTLNLFHIRAQHIAERKVTHTHTSHNSENANYKRCNYIGFNSRTKICLQICILANTQSSLTPVTNHP